MTTTEQCVHCDHLTATIEAAHERALVALTSPVAGRFDAVVWLSAHLAAVERVIDPLLDRHVPRTTLQRREDRRVTHAMQLLLRRLEQHAAGDVHAPRGGVAVLRRHLVALLTEHAASEHLLLEELARVLGPDETARVAARYERSVASGPTRPHPHVPHGALAARVAFTVDRMRDHVMDVLDARHVPIPAPRRTPRPHGKWGNYLLGSMEADRPR